MSETRTCAREGCYEIFAIPERRRGCEKRYCSERCRLARKEKRLSKARRLRDPERCLAAGRKSYHKHRAERYASTLNYKRQNREKARQWVSKSQKLRKAFYRWLRFTTLNLTFAQHLETNMAEITSTLEFRESLKAVETAELIRQFGAGMAALEDFWVKNAWRLHELSSRGITDDDLIGTLTKAGHKTNRWKRLFKLYREITAGKLDPAFAINCAPDPGLFAYGRARGVETQKQLAEMDEKEVNSIDRSKGTDGESVSTNKRRAKSSKADRPNLLAIAQKSSARDLIDMILEMVTNAADPKQVADGLMASLRSVASPTNGHAKRKLATV